MIKFIILLLYVVFIIKIYLSTVLIVMIFSPSPNHHGKISNIISNKLDIIGIDIDIIIILLPNSILLDIAPSPESLHILTANSD